MTPEDLLPDEVLAKARAAYEAEMWRTYYTHDKDDMAGLIHVPGYRKKRALAASRAVLVAALGPLVEQLARENAAMKQEIDAAWFNIARGWDIESREELEAASKTNGWEYALAQAVHHMWKRRVKEDAAPAAPLVSPPGKGALPRVEDVMGCVGSSFEDCPLCSGESCSVHGHEACDCDTLDRHGVEAPPSAPPVETRKGPKCINCGEDNDGGYATEDIGPFCASCWDAVLEAGKAAEAPAETPRETCATCRFAHPSTLKDCVRCGHPEIGVQGPLSLGFGCNLHQPLDAPMPEIHVDPLTPAEEDELDRIAADMLLPDLKPRERALVRKAVRFTLKACRPAPRSTPTHWGLTAAEVAEELKEMVSDPEVSHAYSGIFLAAIAHLKDRPVTVQVPRSEP